MKNSELESCKCRQNLQLASFHSIFFSFHIVYYFQKNLPSMCEENLKAFQFHQTEAYDNTAYG
jgi:hypothetical protein